MRKEMKDLISRSATAFTVAGLGTAVGWATMAGTSIALSVLTGGRALSKSEAIIATLVMTGAGLGTGYLTMRKAWVPLMATYEEILDIFPTIEPKKEVSGNE